MTSDMPDIITRFAPSPTGFLHIGGARTALYNWLFAKANGGKFLLRIEDTDTKRTNQEAVEAILNGLSWLGLDWDGDAVSQAARADRHREVAETLLAEGHAYKCFSSAEETAELRNAAREAGERFRGDMWRDRQEEAPDDTPYSIRVKMLREGSETIDDQVQGEVTVQNGELDDMIILRSDGTPTYMLAVVVDDHDMGVTHIVRGDDHLNNAFRQLPIYKAMNWPVPVYAHIPLIHGADGKKFSKRHGALGVEAYAEMGFLPEAMRNYLLRLGWSHGDDEIISTHQATEWFNLENIGKGPSRFDFDKLDSLNAHYMRALNGAALLPFIKSDLEKHINHTLSTEEEARIVKALPSLAERAKRLPDIVESAPVYCDIRPLALTDKAAKLFTDETRPVVVDVANELEGLGTWKSEEIKASIMSLAQARDLKPGKVMQPLRAALTGGMPSGDLAETLEILGQVESIARLRDQAAA